ncbi:phosphate ABC transporter membrane protein 1, PhoT family [Bellilinea caldifistulae]|uniref:Phosphate transport system permease protein n=1 Tax=Bellilinea caldifistulae TaxID=360411 RepID=A0A0P6X3L8_9CHLR|nr:phosphate ABC transporter permease subunit PstC [Bellilinea caldifistulae]KPL75845.1 phosphate ABC transporter permease [Bellilinea caldifistulae]GAP11394.1 phosphate ABC transporter membrane protein 1, PhoT family [Bellilinea caldifistulae]
MTTTIQSLKSQNHLKRDREKKIVRALTFVFALLSVGTTAGIIYELLNETILFFREVSIIEFFTDTRWTPLFASKRFGVLPLVNGTLLVAAGAMLVAVPLGLLAAIFLSEYASERLRRILKPILEILAGIPTVVYGYFALLFITPILRDLFPETQIFNAASASIAMGFMILPLMASVSEDALSAVPRSLREAAYAMGATKFETATQVVLPAALSGVAAAFILAVSRAIGETMIVAIAAGQQPKLTLNPLQSVETMTAYIVQVSLGDTPHQSIAYKTIFAVGMLLFVMTLVMNIISYFVTKRFREKYE